MTILFAKGRQIVCSRGFAAGVLAVITLFMATAVSVNSRAVTVTDGEKSRVVLTMHSDPYKAVETAGIDLNSYDTINVDPKAGTIDVARAMTVEVKADGVSTLLYMTDGTVTDALFRAGVTVGQYDTLSESKDSPIADGMAIQVDRVAYEEYTVTTAIPFTTQTKYTTVLKPGATKVSQAGVNGEKVTTYRKTIVNGQVVKTDTVSEKTTKQPVTKILLKGANYGTPLSAAPFTVELDGKGQPVKYKTLYAGKSCTAYSSHGKGASGRRLGLGTIAVNPKLIPYGSKLWITSADGKFVYGYAIAADTGGFAKGTRTFADLCFDTYSEACQFGRKSLNIYVLQ